MSMTKDKCLPASRVFGNHLLALVAIHAEPTIRIRELSTLIGLTERSTQRVVGDLEESGFLRVSRRGRRNHYSIDTDLSIDLPDGRHIPLANVLHALSPRPRAG